MLKMWSRNCGDKQRTLAAAWLLLGVLHCSHSVLIDKNETLARKLSAFRKTLTEGNDYIRFIPTVIENGKRQPIKVKLFIYSVDGLKVDSDQQTASVNILLCLSWTDPRLQWDMDKGPFRQFFVTMYRYWTPRISFINTERSSRRLDIPLLLRSSGMAESCNSYNVIVACVFDMTAFPYDEHNCTAILASRAYDNKDVILEVDNLTSSGPPMLSWQWRLGFNVESRVIEHQGMTNVSALVLSFRLSRRSSIYGCRVHTPLWITLFLLVVSLLAPAEYGRPLTCVLLLGASLQHGYLATLVKGSTTTPRLLVLSSAVVGTCLAALFGAYLRTTLVSPAGRWSTLRPLVTTLERVVILPIIGLLAGLLIIV